MKHFYSLGPFFFLCLFQKKLLPKNFRNFCSKIYDDANGKIITNPQLIEFYYCQKERVNGSSKKTLEPSAAQTPVEMCVLTVDLSSMKLLQEIIIQTFLYTTGLSIHLQNKAITNIADQKHQYF